MDRSPDKTKIDELREELSKLRKKRDRIILEKGLIARDNNDLRENSTYDYWDQIERNVTSRIYRIIEEIQKSSGS
jgi:transcription elongation GreA/GreB family factor